MENLAQSQEGQSVLAEANHGGFLVLTHHRALRLGNRVWGAWELYCL